MKPYGGYRNKRACPIHGDNCAVLHKNGKPYEKAAKKAERQRKKLLIEESIREDASVSTTSFQDVPLPSSSADCSFGQDTFSPKKTKPTEGR